MAIFIKNRFQLNIASLKIACLSKQRIHFSGEIIRKPLALIDLYNFSDFLIGVCVAEFFLEQKSTCSN